MSLIENLIAEGHMYRDDSGQLVGIASDGEHLVFGFADQTIADYLAGNPTPDKW